MQHIQKLPSAPLLPALLWQTLPAYLCDAVQSCGATSVEELRLYRDRRAWVCAQDRRYPLDVILGRDQLHAILVNLCHGSLYAHADTIREGYLSPGEGLRVGVAGDVAVEGGRIIGVGELDSLVIRIPHAVRVSADPILERLFDGGQVGSLLLLSPPGVGKTTLLRAIAIGAAAPPYAKETVLVDTRRELSTGVDGSYLTLHTLSGYPRDVGIEIAVRSLGAELIVCDEIGSDADARAILHAANCGVPLAASAHAATVGELLCRPAIRALHDAHVFATYVELSRRGNAFSYRFLSWQNADRRGRGDCDDG